VVVPGGTLSVAGSPIAFNVTDNTNRFYPNIAPLVVTGGLQTTGSGSASIAVLSPTNITGTHGGTLKISFLTYDCTGIGSGNNQGATFVNQSQPYTSLVASGTAGACINFPGSATVTPTLDFDLNLFLDDRTLPADNYQTTGGGFTLLLTAN